METRMRAVLPDQGLIRMYEQTALAREFEERCAEQYTKGNITGFLHLYSGQEAVAVGATTGLHPDDYVLSAYCFFQAECISTTMLKRLIPIPKQRGLHQLQPPLYAIYLMHLMIRFKRHRLTDTASVVSFGAATCTTVLGLFGQFIEQSGVGHSTYFCSFD